MARPPQLASGLRRLAAWSLAWVVSGALYLLLIDTTSLPELLVGAGAATFAATGFELAREQRIVGETIRGRWLLRVYRPLLRVPSDIALVSLAALRQTVRRHPACGEFRAVRFRCGDEEQLESGRRSLTESLGSFAPNTIVAGVDRDREVVLAHQLRRTGGRHAIDPLDLG